MRPSEPAPSDGYRETIQYAADGERKYIRYFDGRGHFGHVRLQLIPHPGATCCISVDAACPLPDESCTAIKAALMRRFERGTASHMPLNGFEVRLTGGSYLDRHSYPAACAIAACMAYDQAMHKAGLLVVEPYVGIRLVIEHKSLEWTVKTMAALLGEVRAVCTINDVMRLQAEIPMRYLDSVKSALRLQYLESFPLPQEQRYRPVFASANNSGDFSDLLDDWT
jgi:elongation factor G